MFHSPLSPIQNPTTKCLCLFVVKCLHWMSYVDLEYRVFVYDLNMKFQSPGRWGRFCDISTVKSSQNHNHITNNNNKEISSQVCMSTQQHVKIVEFSKRNENFSNKKYRRQHKIFKCTSERIFNTYYLLIMFALVYNISALYLILFTIKLLEIKYSFLPSLTWCFDSIANNNKYQRFFLMVLILMLYWFLQEY